MSDPTGYEVLSQAFVAEGVDTMFALLGDANMYWGAIMAQKYKVHIVHARHEHCAVAMADGYARLTGKVGVATVTCGPGFTQIMTALTTAARGSVPLVVFAGDSPTSASKLCGGQPPRGANPALLAAGSAAQYTLPARL